MSISMSHGNFNNRRPHKDIPQRRWKKTQKNDKSLTGKVVQPKTTEWYRTEKIEKKQNKVKCLRAKVPELKTTERLQTVKIEKKTAQGQVSHREDSKSGNRKIDIAQRRKRKET